jgi:uncharacterized protein involved in response to NO
MTGIPPSLTPVLPNAGPTPAPGSSLAWLLAAPHRIAFALGASMIVACSVWWAGAAFAIWSGWPPRNAIRALELHGLVMVFGFMPFFFTGFLFTAVPKWLAARAPTALELSAGLSAQVAGWAVFFIGAQSTDAAFAATLGGAGLSAVAFGSTTLWLRFISLVRRSPAPDRVHAVALAVTGGVGVAALWSAAAGLAGSWHPVVGAATQIGLWMFVGGTFVTAAHRMIPFMGATALAKLDARSPQWLLPILLGLVGIEGLFAAADAAGLPLNAWLVGVRVAFELSAGLSLSAQVWRWAVRLPLRIRMVAMLHAAFAWLAASFVLGGFAHWHEAALGGNWHAAPLHAFTMGFLASILLAMLTRIICAQTGRAVVADDLLWRLFWMLQVAVVLRLAASMAANFVTRWQWPLTAASAGLWSLLWLTWAWRYVPWLARPRQDGRPDRAIPQVPDAIAEARDA